MKSTVKKFNTNNAWGFGGGIGTHTTFENGYSIRKGTAHFRHLKSERFCHYRNDKGVGISKAELEEATK